MGLVKQGHYRSMGALPIYPHRNAEDIIPRTDASFVNKGQVAYQM